MNYNTLVNTPAFVSLIGPEIEEFADNHPTWDDAWKNALNREFEKLCEYLNKNEGSNTVKVVGKNNKTVLGNMRDIKERAKMILEYLDEDDTLLPVEKLAVAVYNYTGYVSWVIESNKADCSKAERDALDQRLDHLNDAAKEYVRGSDGIGGNVINRATLDLINEEMKAYIAQKSNANKRK